MKLDSTLVFEPFRVDPADARLFRGESAVPLTPKAFDVLCYLLSQAGRLVTKEEILRQVWNDVIVSDASLKVCIREVRQALGDGAKNPKFVETVHRRGYRFIGKITTTPVAAAPIPLASASAEFVGRDAELRQLSVMLDKARQGERQVVFLTGEPGAGKTTLLGEFMRQARAAGAWVSVGHCFEQYGLSEPFLPLLEAVSQLCRDPKSSRFAALLGSHAPTWLVQLPWLHGEVPPRDVLGATAERMLREICETLETLTTDTPLLLVLEDLHWGDFSTVDLLPALARRRQRAKLMLVASYRPVEVILANHPLRTIKQDLLARRLGLEIPLEPFDESTIDEFLARRCSGSPRPEGLANRLYRRSHGNPLFLANLVDDWLAQGLLVRNDEGWQWRDAAGADEVPEGIRALLERRIDRLGGDERRVLDAASVAGPEFTAPAVAAALDEDVVSVESRCEDLARRHMMLEVHGTVHWPDGTAAARYRFLHELYRVTLYGRIPPARCARMHQRIGRRLESGYGAAAGDIAGELAGHFDQGRDVPRAVQYLRQAAEVAARRGANREAADYLGRALDLTQRLGEADRPVLRLALLEQRGLIRRASSDWAAATSDFRLQAEEARHLGLVEIEARGWLNTASALSWNHRTECQVAVDAALALLPNITSPLFRHHIQGWSAYWNLLLGDWRDEDAAASAAAAAAARSAGDRTLWGQHIGRYSFFLCLQSRYAEAAAAAEEGVKLALANGDSFEYLLCHFFKAWALLHSGRWGEMLAVLESARETADRNGHRPWSIFARLQTAWLHDQAGDSAAARRICEAELGETRELQIGSAETFCLVMLGIAQFGEGDVAESLRTFEIVARKVNSLDAVMAWIERMRIHGGLSECWLAMGDLDGAKREAEALCRAARQSGERTYWALGKRTLAVAALMRGDLATAEAELHDALALVAAGETPLAEWRVCETAAWLAELRNSPDASRFRDRSTTVQNALAASLPKGANLVCRFDSRKDGATNHFQNHGGKS